VTALLVATSAVIGATGALADAGVAPGFRQPVQLVDGVPVPSVGLPTGTEPRTVSGPGGLLWALTNDRTGTVELLRSRDGRAWTRTASPLAPAMPSPDVDIAKTTTGRIVVTDLDAGGLRIVTAYSDDRGRTWRESAGTAFADQDRPWLAAGPDRRVHLLFHNLFSGTALENMFVATSTDNGGTFGQPVPITLPGDQAYADMQCGGSSGPSSLTADPRTGRLYAVWGSRSARRGGGCGAFLTSGPAISVEGADRIWVATSPDGSPGSWTTTLAVDATTTGSSLGMLFSPAAVDRAGNVYLVYPETPRAYPDYAGATIKYRVAPPGLSRWSAPAVIADGSAARNAGHFATHVVAGAAGRLDLAYFAGLNRPGRTPAWYATMAQVRGATTTRPRVRETRLSPFASYTGTATVLAGVCASGPAAGVEQGLTCPRATDNFGLTLLPDCRLAVVWPAVDNEANRRHTGTYMSLQRSGPTVC
jgi:hypothetical protein